MPYNLPHLLLPLLGGFIFIRLWNRTRWYAARADKERLLIYASIAGLIFFCLAFAITIFPPLIPCSPRLPCLPTWWATYVKFPYSGVSFLSFILGATLWWPLNNVWPFKRLWNTKSMYEKILADEGEPFELLLDEALHKAQAVMVTLGSRKVYIGYLLSAPEPKADRKNIEILPTFSGYRDKDTLDLTLTNNYATAYEGIVEGIAEAQERLEEARAALAALPPGGTAADVSPPSPAGSEERRRLEDSVRAREAGLKDLEDSLSLVRVVLPIDEIIALSFYTPPIHEHLLLALSASSPP